MAAGDFRIGLDGAFKYGTAGSQAGTATDNVDDVSFSGTARTATAVVRGKTWTLDKPTILEGTLSFTMYDIESDAFYAAIESAFFNKTKIALWAKSAASGKGLDSDFYISGFTPSQDNEGFQTVAVVCRPTFEQRTPVWQ